MEIPSLFLAFLIIFVEGRGNEKRQTGSDCLQCLKYAEAHDCETVTRCEADEECFTEQYITVEGHIFFDLGCKSKQICDAINKVGKRSLDQPQRRQSDGRITLCEECCTGESCNRKGCDSYNSTKRMCYTCSGEQAVENPKDCATVTMCGTHEQCYHAYGLTNELQIRHAMGCISDRACSVMYTSGGPSLGHPSPLSRSGRDVSEIYERNHLKRDMGAISFKRQVRPDGSPMFTLTSCEYCCNNSYCNKNECVNGFTPVTQKSIATSSTRMSTTRTTTLTPTTLSASTTTTPPSTKSMSTASIATLTTSVASTTPHPSITQKSVATTTTMMSSSGTTTMIPTTLSTSTTTVPLSTTPTASLRTLTTSVASTPPQPSTICFVCSQQGCSYNSCTGATPYCLNFLDHNADGNKQETKRCGSELECEMDWYNVTALSDICSVYEPWQLYSLKFSCTYCCVRNYCNRDTNPPRETLYYPKRQNS